MTNNDDQVSIIFNYFNRMADYPEYIEVQEARVRLYESGEFTEEDISLLISFASYVGTLKRLAYYKFVHKRGFDVRYLADASIKAFMFTNAYRFELQPFLRRKVFKDVIDSSRYPRWTRLGLIGGSTRELNDLGKEFSEWMDEKEAMS